MVDVKLDLRNRIMVDMKPHLDAQTLSILENILMKNFENITMESSTTLATIDNTNDYIIQLFNIRKAPKLSEKTCEAYLRTVNKFIDAINKPLTQVTTYDVERYIHGLFTSGNTAVSLNNTIRNLSAFFEFMRKNKIIVDNPCEGIDRFPEVKKPISHLEAVEMDSLRNACKTAKQRAMLEFLRSTALRRGEVPDIKIGDIDFSTGKIIVYGHKNRTYRTVFIDDLAKKYLKKYLNERQIIDKSDYLFYGKNGKPITAHGVYDLMHVISNKAAVKMSPHVIRKTTATNICKRGGSEDQAGEYLGHTPTTVTGRHYTYKGDQNIEDIFKHYIDAV